MAQNKKQKEKKYLIDFFNSHVGQKWKAQQGIISYEETESPDFIFLTNKNKKIGMEITNFFAKSKHCRATQVLTNIGNKVCRYCHKKYNLEISILIDKYDKRIGQPKSKEELWDLYYNPGFTNIFNEEEIKPKIEKTIDENLIKLRDSKGLIKKWINVNGELLCISICPFPNMNGQFDCRVNNESFMKPDPIEEMQDLINKKNEKYHTYLKKCEECFLLLCLPESIYGNYCYLTKKTYKHRFDSLFKKIFLYDEKENIIKNLHKKLFCN